MQKSIFCNFKEGWVVNYFKREWFNEVFHLHYRKIFNNELKIFTPQFPDDFVKIEKISWGTIYWNKKKTLRPNIHVCRSHIWTRPHEDQCITWIALIALYHVYRPWVWPVRSDQRYDWWGYGHWQHWHQWQHPCDQDQHVLHYNHLSWDPAAQGATYHSVVIGLQHNKVCITLYAL